MDRSSRLAGIVAVLCAGLASRAMAQGPTIDTPLPSLPGLESALGPGPGAPTGPSQPFGPSPGFPIGARAGAGGVRAFSTLSTPPQAPTGSSAPTELPAPLEAAPPPDFGTLSFPEARSDVGSAEGIGLDQAIERLVACNLALKAQALEIPQAQADMLTASLRANPVLYADSQLVPYGSYSRERAGGPVQYDLNVSVPLDLTHKRQARMVVAGRARRVVEAQFQDAVRRQVGTLAAAHLDVLAARERVRFAEASVEGLDEILRPLSDQMRLGKITLAEVNRVRLQRETAALLVADSQENLRQTQIALALLLDLPPEQAEARGPIIPRVGPPPGRDELLAVALAERPDLNAFRLGVGRADAEIDLAVANRMNDVYVLYQPFTYQDNSPFGRQDATSWAVGVTVPLPVFNRNQGAIARARVNADQTRVELAALERRVTAEVEMAEREFQVSRAALERLDTVLRPAAEQVLATVRRQYEEGAIGVIDFVTARQEYNQVVRQYLETSIRHRRSMIELNLAVGRRVLP